MGGLAQVSRPWHHESVFDKEEARCNCLFSCIRVYHVEYMTSNQSHDFRPVCERPLFGRKVPVSHTTTLWRQCLI